MFERFTRDARAVVVLAAEEARDRRDDHVGTEHLVIGLAGHEPSRAVFQSFGIDAQRLRAALDELDSGALEAVGVRTASPMPRPARRPKHIPFTSGAKESLEQTLRLVIAESEREISSRHIGVVVSTRGPRDQATILLEAAGIVPEDLRRAFEGIRS